MHKNLFLLMLPFSVAALGASGQISGKAATDPNVQIPSAPTCQLYVRNTDLSTTITVRFAQTTFKQVAPGQLSAAASVSQIPQLGGYRISRAIDSTDLQDTSTNNARRKVKKRKIGDLMVLADEDVPPGSEYYAGSGTYIADVTHVGSADAVSRNSDSLSSQTDTLVISHKDYWSLAVHRYSPRQDGRLPGKENEPFSRPMPPGRLPPGGQRP